MPTPKKGPRHGGSPAHQRLMMANLATALFEHGRITTTESRARTLRPIAEKLITKAKKGDLHNRREVLKTIRDKGVVHVLFTEIAPTFAERPGGYTRITKIGPRKGDNAPMAVIELVTEAYSPRATTSRTSSSSASATSSTTAEPASPAAPAEVEAEGVDGETEVVDTQAAETGDAEVATVADTDGDEAAEAGDEPKYAGSHPAVEGSDEAPEGFPVKGNENSMKYHEPDGQWYDQTVAEVWFDSAESAEAAGFTKAGS